MNIIFDLDDTLSDASARAYLVETKPPQWDKFNAAANEDPPIRTTVRLARALYEAGHYIAIWTGRSREHRASTIQWLRTHGVPFNELRMRPVGDYMPSATLKLDWLTDWRRQNREPDLIIDDNDRTIQAFRQAGILAFTTANPRLVFRR